MTEIPLLIVSYGWSSLILNGAIAGIILNLAGTGSSKSAEVVPSSLTLASVCR